MTTTKQSPSRATLLDINDSTLRSAALAYAGFHWPVLPLKPRDKTPLTSHGLHDASTIPARIVDWWTRWPDANIGLRTGVRFDVLDIDGLTTSPAMAEFVALAGNEYKHRGPVSSTGRGFHLLFRASGARNSANKRPGLDYRGNNGYIVAAPSIHPNGGQYRWLRDGEPPEPPIWLAELQKPPRTFVTSGIPPENLPSILAAFAPWAPTHPLRQQGTTWVANCIFHDDRTPSLVLFTDTNSFFCFGCDQWGDSANLIRYAREGKLR
jgi:hypothetical protein